MTTFLKTTHHCMLFYSIHTLDGRHFSRLTFAQLIAMLDCSVVSIEAGGDAGQHAENVIDESNRLIEEISKGRRAATLLRSIVNVFEEGQAQRCRRVSAFLIFLAVSCCLPCWCGKVREYTASTRSIAALTPPLPLPLPREASLAPR